MTKRNRQERLRSDEGRDRGAKAARAIKRIGLFVTRQFFFLSCPDLVAVPPGPYISVVDQACLVDVEQPEGLHRRT